MKKSLLFFFIVFAASLTSSKAANRYWVGGTGVWNNSEHWSVNSGGAGGASIPSSNDDVFFNQQSFSADKQTVMVTTDAVCKSIDWSSIDDRAIFSAAANKKLTVYGSYRLSTLLYNGFKGQTIFASSLNTNVINTFGQLIIGNWVFDGAGSWMLNDDVTTIKQSSIVLLKGDLNTNDKNVKVGNFNGNSNQQRSLNLTSSEIYIIDTWDFSSSTNLNFTPASSRLIFEQGIGLDHFRRGNLNYGNFAPLTTFCTPSGTACSANLVITLTGANIACNGSCNGTASVVSVTGGSGSYTYVWSPGNPAGQGTTAVTGLCAGTYTVKVTDNVSHLFCFCSIQIAEPAVLFDYELSTTPPTCNGLCNATSSVDATGGTFPYTYTWTPGAINSDIANNICAGTYTVGVTDSRGCSATTTIVVTEPAPLVANGTATNLTCHGICNGASTVTPSGGTAAYSFNWTPGNPTGDGTPSVTNLCAGTYTCTITDSHNCTTTFDTVITQPTAVTGSITSQTNALCRGASTGSVTVAGANGTPGYTYSINGVTFQPSGTFGSLAAGTYTITVKDANGCTATVSVTITQPATAVAGIISAQTNVLCKGGSTGSVTVTGTNGTPGYTYSIDGITFVASGTFGGLAAGTYTITVKDANGCTTTVDVTITEPATVVSGNISAQTNVLCFGGSSGTVTIAGNGGTPGYTYSLNGVTFQASGTFNGLALGSYTITVKDANGCTATVPVTITQPPVLTGSVVSQVNVLCHNGNTGSVTVAGSGGTPGYTYSINGVTFQGSSTFSGLIAGTYTITIKDSNGCTVTVSATITQPSAVTGSITSQTNVLCRGANTGSVTVLGANGTPGYTYSINGITFQVSGTFSSLLAGVYTVTVKDANGCTTTVSVTITQPATAVAGIISSQTNVLCKGGSTGSVTVTGTNGTPGYTYSSDGIIFVASGTFGGLAAGTYTITVKDANGCTTTVSVIITEPATVVSGNISSQTNVLCFGASTGCVTVAGSGGTPGYTYSQNGIVFQASGTFCGLAAGSYTITVKDANGCTTTVAVTITQPSAFTGSITSQTNVLCNGGNTGSVTVAGSGGTPGYTYSINGITFQASSTFNGLAAGSYTITIKDANNCIVTVPLTISQPIPVTGSITSQTNVLCRGANTGSVTVAGANGTPGYTYSIDGITFQVSGTFSNLIAGVYTITVKDANGCTSTVSVTITQPATAVAGIINSQTNVLCKGGSTGSVTVTGTNGTPGYTYSIDGITFVASGTFGGLAAGTYTITVKDANGCTTTLGVTITEPATVVSGSISSQTNVLCFGASTGCVTVAGSGGTSGYTYSQNGIVFQASGTFCGLAAGSYTITVKDANGCTTTVAVTIAQPSAFTGSITSQTNVLCNGGNTGSVTVAGSGGTPGYTYSINGITFQVSNIFGGLSAGVYTVTIKDVNGCTITVPVTITQPIALTGSITSQTNVLCNGGSTGSVTVSGSNGTPSYTYSIDGINFLVSGTFNGLTAGAYTINIHDANGCAANVSVTITQPNVLNVSISPTLLMCHGDCNSTAAATVTGGTPAYTFVWSPGVLAGNGTSVISSLCVGTYNLNITDAHGCLASSSVTITEPPILTLSTTSTDVTCFGLCNGTASATAGGGTPGYSYLWLPGGQTTSSITNLCSGTYTVTVTDAHNCTVTNTITIAQPPQLLGNPSIVNNVSCHGACDGSATSAPIGGVAPYSFNWTPGSPVGDGTNTITNLCAGTYNLIVTDFNSCISTQPVTITQPSVLISPITNKTNSCNICNGTATVVPAGGTGPYTILWMPTGQSAATATGLCPNITYTVTVTDSHNCSATDTVTIFQNINIIVTTTNTTLSCFGSCNGTATANASGGNPPYSYLWTGPTGPFFTQSVNGLCAGTYTVKVTDAVGCFNTATVTFVNPPQLSVNTSVTNASCNGVCDGTATAMPTGGTGVYSYQWLTALSEVTPTISNLCSGTYLVTVTDANGCTNTGQATITQPTTVNDNATIIVASCILNNGSITVTPSGGAGGYSYSWGPGNPTGQGTSTITNLALGAYTLTITDAASCTYNFNYSLASPAGPTLTTSTTPISCNGLCDGGASVVATGGAGGYTYNWTPGNPIGNGTSAISSLCPNTYIVQVTDAVGCVSLSNVTLTNPILMLAHPTIVNTNCNNSCNGSISLAPTGGTGTYSYAWLPGGQSTSSINNLCAGTYSVTITDANNCSINRVYTITSPPLLVVTLSSTNDLCHGVCNGTATATVAGGTPAYTYSWSNGPSITPNLVNLCPNQYIVTVTDAHSCIAKDTVVITEPALLTTTTSHLNISCNNLCNGTAIVSANGGTQPYSYVWNPGNILTPTASGLCAGTYTATVVDANGCSSSPAPVVITQPIAISPTATFTLPTCNGLCNGTAIASPTGGTPPYNYTWMPGNIHSQTINNLCAGSYTVTVTDLLNCTATQIINIVDPPILNANVSSTPPTCTGLCNGSATATPLGGTPGYTYSWTPVISASQTLSNLCPGVYSVTVTDINNCTSTQNITVNPAAAIDVVIGSTPASCGSCNGTINLTPTTGTAPYTYNWSPAVTGQGTPNGTSICAGIYNVTVTDFHGCDSTFVIPMNNSSGPSGETVVTTDASCNSVCNGSGTVNPIGGLAPYSFVWNNPPTNTANATAINLCAGSYLVQVTDANNCVHFSPVTINQPTPIVANETITNTTCGGLCNGSISVAPTGGTIGYSYSWAPGNPIGQGTPTITSLCQGSYTLTITDANNCTQIDTFVIGQSAPIVATINQNTISCSNACTGMAYITVTSGTPPYLTQWNDPLGQTNDTASALCAGDYSVTITDALGCNTTLNTTISATPPVVANAAVTDATCGVCNGQIAATPTGGTGMYNYIWSNGQNTSSISNLCVGLYSVSITDAIGCNAVISVPVSNVSGPTSALINSSNVTCFGLCDGAVTGISPIGGVAPYTYNWIQGGQTTSTLSNLCAGTYFVQITDANGCSLIDSVVITQPASMLANPSFSAPSCGACDGSVSINPTGCAGIVSVLWNTGSSSLSLTNLCAGVYSVNLTCSNGCTQNVVIPLNSQSGPLLTVNTTPASCNGTCDGTATVVASNGVPPYSYVWNNVPPTGGPIATNLCVGNYVVQVTGNNGCVTIANATISQPSAIGLSLANIQNPTCSGSGNGTITAVPSGGTLPYTFSWAPMGGNGITAVGLSVGSFTVTVTDAHGCSVNQTTNIMTPPQLTIASVVTNPSCNTLSDGAIDITVSGGSPGYTYQWSGGSTATTEDISLLPPGTFTITVTDTHLCTFSDTINVNPAQTVIANAGNDTTFCNLGAITLSALNSLNGVNFQWFQIPGNTSVGNTSTVSVTPPTGTTSYYVIVDNGTGCSDKDTVVVTSTPLPTSHAGNDVFICQPTAVLLDGGTSINASSYEWFQIPSNTSISSNDTVTVFPNVGTTSYYLVIANSSGCASNDTVNIIVNPILTAHAGNDTTICVGSTFSLDASTSLNVTGYNWYQLPSNTLVGNAATVSVTPGFGITSYYVVVDNGTICTNADTVNVTAITLPVAHAGNDSILCVPGSVTLNATTSINAVSYEWFQIPTNTSLGTTATITINPPVGVNTQYYVVVSNGVCTSNDTVNYIVYPGITAHAGNDTTICVGATYTLNATTSLNGTGYNWYQLPSNTLVGNAATVSVTPILGITSYYVVVDNGTICTNTDTVNVTAIALPVAHAGNDSILCVPGSVTLNATTSVNAVSYEWFQIPTNTSLGTTATITINPAVGVNTQYYVVVSNGVCANNDTVNYIVYPGITAHAGNDTTICIGATYTLNATTSLNGTGYNWYQLPSNTLVGSAAAVSVTPILGITSYYVVVDNGTICSNTDTVNVTVIALPIAHAGNDTTICQTPNVILNASSSLNAVSYQWYQVPANSIGTGVSVTVNPPIGATTTYYVVVDNGLGCIDQDTINVTLDPIISANAGADTTFCQPGSVILNGNASTGNIATYQWFQLPNSSIANTATTSVTPTSGINGYYLEVSNATGCSTRDTVMVTANPLPVVNAGQDVVIIQGASTVLGGSPTGPSGAIYYWSPYVGLNDSALANPTATPELTTVYTVMVTSAEGCIASDAVLVTVSPTIVFGSGFSPNNDGANDLWQIDYIERYPNCTVEVYNRWGELLFQSVGYHDKWDGTFKGKPLPVGTYYYIINLNDPLFPDALTGPLTILR